MNKTNKNREYYFNEGRLNDDIKSEEIMLIRESDKRSDESFTFREIASKEKVLKEIEYTNSDLVWIATDNKSNLPVCKIIDFQKLFYREKKQLSKSKKNIGKSVNFNSSTDLNDIRTKVKKIISWIENTSPDCNMTIKITLKIKSRREQYEINKQKSYEKSVLIFKEINDGLVKYRAQMNNEIELKGRYLYVFIIQRIKAKKIASSN